MPDSHDDVRDLKGRAWRVMVSIVLGFGSMVGLIVAAAVFIHRVGKHGGHGFAEDFDLGTLVGMAVLLAVAWYAVLHWFAHRNDRRLRALSLAARAWVIKRNRRA